MSKRINVYSTEEVADILMVTQRTVYNYISKGQLRATKIGKYWRITEEQLTEFLNTGTEPTSTNNH